MKMCLRQTLRLGLNNYGSKLRVVEHIWIECHKTKVKTNYFPVVLLSQSQPAIKLKPKETTDYFQHLIIRKLYRISYINFYRGQIHFFDFVSHCKSTQGTPAKIAIVFRLLSCISSQGWEGERSCLPLPPIPFFNSSELHLSLRASAAKITILWSLDNTPPYFMRQFIKF